MWGAAETRKISGTLSLWLTCCILRLISILKLLYNVDETGLGTWRVASFGISGFEAFIIDNTQSVWLVGKMYNLSMLF
jgi:hypothetical protein